MLHFLSRPIRLLLVHLLVKFAHDIFSIAGLAR